MTCVLGEGYEEYSRVIFNLWFSRYFVEEQCYDL